jgi:putative peptidoglycan lipid II flippase
VSDGDGVVRSSALISAGVLLSRLTGLVRTVLLISVLGGGGLADVYTFANNVPNLVYELLAGGVLSAVLLPLFVDLVRRDDRRGTSAVVSVAVGGLAALTVAGLLAAPALGWAIASLSGGGVDRAEQQAAFVVLLRWFVPQVFFYGVITVVTSLLQAKRRFAAAAFAPVVNNVVVIAAYLVVRRVTDLDLTVATLGEVQAERWTLLVLGLGTTLGVVANALVLLPSVGRARVGFRPTLDWRHPVLGRLAVAARGALGYVLVSQVGVTVTSLLANGFKQTGGYASWTYANLVFYVVYGLLVVSITTAVGPELAYAAQQDDLAVVRREWVRGLRLIVLLVAPVAAGMAVLAGPLWEVLPLDQGGVALTAVIFRWFAIGLLPFSVIQHVVRAYYALSETRPPFRVAVLQNALVVGAGVVAAPVFGVSGLAAAYAGGYLVTAVVAFSWFAHRLGRLRRSEVRAVPRMIAAALGMAVVVAASRALLTWGGRTASPVLSIVIGAVVGVASYVLFLATLDADGDLWAFVAVARRIVRR